MVKLKTNMGSSDSKAQEIKANGPMSNANANSVTIVEQLQEHSSMLTIFMIIIVIILLIHTAIKLYAINKRCIKKAERVKSRNNLNEV